jgi:hypothetical protein
MALLNSYATLQDLLDFRSTTDTDSVDDGVAEKLLEGSSRYIDNYCGRTFYPRVETLLLDVPEEDPLYLPDDLLAVTSLLNGDSTTIASSDYTLLSANLYPKWGIKIKDSSSVSWLTDDTASAEEVISLTGFFGYHNEYSRRAWPASGTLANPLTSDTSDGLTVTLADGHGVKANNIFKIDNELFIANSISSSDTITVAQRADNGSTIAAHTSDTAVYVWKPQADIVQACLEIAASAYRRRKGQGVTGAAQVTAAGVVITPQDVPGQAREIINKYVRVC